MRRYFHRKLFGWVFALVISIPFALHGIGHKGWDPIGQLFGTSGLSSGIPGSPDSLKTSIMNQMAVSTIDPSINEANSTALAAGRATTIQDVWDALNNNGEVGDATNANSAVSGSTVTPGDPLQGNTPSTPVPNSTDLGQATQVISGVLGASSSISAPTFTQNPDSIIAGFIVAGIKGKCTITIFNSQASRICN